MQRRLMQQVPTVLMRWHKACLLAVVLVICARSACAQESPAAATDAHANAITRIYVPRDKLSELLEGLGPQARLLVPVKREELERLLARSAQRAESGAVLDSAIYEAELVRRVLRGTGTLTLGKDSRFIKWRAGPTVLSLIHI